MKDATPSDHPAHAAQRQPRRAAPAPRPAVAHAAARRRRVTAAARAIALAEGDLPRPQRSGCILATTASRPRKGRRGRCCRLSATSGAALLRSETAGSLN
eukprot:scaffold46787_cov67-Phaeocystis_antarctica.AAC.2